MLNHDWQSNELRPDVFYVPTRVRTLESGDCFFLASSTSTLVIINFTVAVSHPVKGNGLKQIVERFNSRTIEHHMLVFMTPKNHRITALQRITIKKEVHGESKVMKIVPNNVKPFQKKQFYCEYSVGI